MRKQSKNYFCKIAGLVFIMSVIFCVSFSACAVTDSGSFTKTEYGYDVNVNWSYDSSTKTLTVGGFAIKTLPDSQKTYETVVGADGKKMLISWHEDCAPQWYKYRNEAETLVVDEGTLKIDDYAFVNFKNLKYISLPDSLQIIAKGAFYGCDSIKEVSADKSKKMNEGVLYLPEALQLLEDCIGIDDVKVSSLPGGIIALEENFFGTQTYLNPNNWNDGVFYIGEYLVDTAVGLSGICNVKDGTRVIGVYAFEDRVYLQEVILPKSVENIGSFIGCDSLKKVTVYNHKADFGWGEGGYVRGGDGSFGSGELIGYKVGNVSNRCVPEQIVVKCYKYSGVHDRFDGYEGIEVELMGYSPDASFFERIGYFFRSIEDFFLKLFS